ncbi:MAG: hypothetical protein PHC55_07600 [Bacteroidales bacterium]|jgi:heat shock protein HslJ|nr:hypothetical protein [Bacteroidales bacterium]
MKTKKLLLLIPFLLIMSLMGCRKDSAMDYSVVGSWKCVGFGDTKTNNVKEIEPKDCEECYIMTFREDGTFSGKSTINLLSKNYVVSNNKLSFPNGVLATYVLEEGDGALFTDALTKVFQFSLQESELKLFYSKTEFLVFNRLK